MGTTNHEKGTKNTKFLENKFLEKLAKQQQQK